MKLKEIVSYGIGFLVGGLLLNQLCDDFNFNSLSYWTYVVGIMGYNILLIIHLIDRLKNGDD